MPFFSVVIPLYNKEKYIENTLTSVLSQTCSNFEVIIVNDGSTDASEEKVRTFSDSRIRYYSKENEGVSTARNFGIDKSLSNYITFIDADDYWYPTFLETMQANIGSFPTQDIFTAAIEIETQTRVIPARYSIPKTAGCEVVDYFEASQKETVICTSCAVFHKSVFENVGQFDAELKSGQDTDLWIRIGLAYQVVFCWQIMARYVFDANSLSKDKNHINAKINFSKYKPFEADNPALKTFLDLNRFSIAIKSKLNHDFANFKKVAAEIALRQLPLKKRILLKLSPFLLRKLIGLQQKLLGWNLDSSVFK